MLKCTKYIEFIKEFFYLKTNLIIYKNLVFYTFQNDQSDTKVQLYTTTYCPKTKLDWNKRSADINCTDTTEYMCLPNVQLTELLEFCYSFSLIGIQKGENCI